MIVWFTSSSCITSRIFRDGGDTCSSLLLFNDWSQSWLVDFDKYRLDESNTIAFSFILESSCMIMIDFDVLLSIKLDVLINKGFICSAGICWGRISLTRDGGDRIEIDWVFCLDKINDGRGKPGRWQADS